MKRLAQVCDLCLFRRIDIVANLNVRRRHVHPFVGQTQGAVGEMSE
jgi:hypothetical protein